MIKKSSVVFSGVISTLLVFILSTASIMYVDSEIAIRVMRFLRSIQTLHEITKNIPDLLPYIVLIGTLLFWIIYFYRRNHKKFDILTRFIKLSATTLPVSYLLKIFFQFMFGRTHTRLWLLNNIPLKFEWFRGVGSGCFPSGHMTVFAALGTAVAFYFPQYRKHVFVLLFILGISLILTDYHFLSDVIAGAYLGFITTYTLRFLYEKPISKH